MELRAGYKKTEVGLIPDDWAIGSLESVTHQGIRNGIVDGPFGSNLKTIHYRKSGVPIVTSGYVTDGNFYADSYLYVDPEKFRAEKRSAVSPGDIVMAKIGARCGASAILPASHPVGILSGNALKISVDESRHSTFYVWQVLWDLYLDGRMDVLRTVGAQPAISMANLKKHQIPLPPQTEQRAIATALSDVEALLAKIDQLIAKKRNLKQAAMQQLLTGQTRLPGFSGEWEVKRLADIAQINPGINKPVSAMGAGVLYVTVQDLYSGNSVDIDRLGRIRLSAQERVLYALQPGDIIFGKSSVKRDGIAYPSIFRGAPEPAVCTGFSYRARVLPDLADANYVFYALRWEPTRKWLIEHSQASALTNINKAISDAIPISLPELEEQTAIAAILSDMGAELAALEARRDKTRALKQGMMQALLTGRIRLAVVN